MWRKNDHWDNDLPTFNRNLYYFKSNQQLQKRKFFPKNLNFKQWQLTTGNDQQSYIKTLHKRKLLRVDEKLMNEDATLVLGIRKTDLRNVMHAKIP